MQIKRYALIVLAGFTVVVSTLLASCSKTKDLGTYSGTLVSTPFDPDTSPLYADSLADTILSGARLVDDAGAADYTKIKYYYFASSLIDSTFNLAFADQTGFMSGLYEPITEQTILSPTDHYWYCMAQKQFYGEPATATICSFFLAIYITDGPALTGTNHVSFTGSQFPLTDSNNLTAAKLTLNWTV